MGDMPAIPESSAGASDVASENDMAELARQRLGDNTDLRVADVAGPLPHPDAAFDDVVADGLETRSSR